MNRATLHYQPFPGHHTGYTMAMRQPPGHGDGSQRRPSRLLEMRDNYQRQLLKEREEMMLNKCEDNYRKNLERAERLTKKSAVTRDYPNSRLLQPGHMQPQQQRQITASPSVRDFFKERREMEAKGGYVPPINQHFNQSKRRVGSGNGYSKNSAGVDRANPLAPIKARHSGVSSAPSQHSVRNKPRHKQATPSPVIDENEDFQSYSRAASNKPSPKYRGNPAARNIPQKAGKMSDFQKWQMEQNRAREERLKKLNMRPAPPSGMESENWGREDQFEEDEDDGRTDQEDFNEGLHRQEQELLQRIAQQQAELSRLRKEREEEEELERQEAEMLRQQQAAEREQRRRQQQEAARQRREEEAQLRREEEEQRRAARARQERQRYESLLNQNGTSDIDDTTFSQPNSYRSLHQNNSLQETPRYNPKPPPGNSPRKQTHHRPQPPPRKPPAAPEQDDELIVPGPGADFYAQAVDEEQGVKIKLTPCRVCGRKFAHDRIQKHQEACKKAQKKRSVMDPTQTRTEGTDMAKYIHQGAHKKEPVKKKKADWRRQHEEFITNIRYAKQMQQMEQSGVPLRDLPPPPPSHNPDLVPCPHCGRTFNEQAAERHIPRCQGLKTRPAVNRRR